MATTCSVDDSDGTSPVMKTLKIMKRALYAVLFGGDTIYEASILPEFASTECPEVNVKNDERHQDSVELQKCFIYLTYVLEKVKVLNAENKILKKRVHVLLRKCGKLKNRSYVDSNNNKKCQTHLINNYQTSESNLDSNGNLYDTNTQYYSTKTERSKCSVIMRNASTFCEISTQDQSTLCAISTKDKSTCCEISRNDKSTCSEISKQDRGTLCDIEMKSENSPCDRLEAVNVGSQHEQEIEPEFKIRSRKRRSLLNWYSQIPVRCKVAPLCTESTISPTKIPVPTFQTQVRPDKTPSPRRNLGVSPKTMKKMPNGSMILSPGIRTPPCSIRDKLTYLPPMLGVLVGKTADKVNTDLEVEWANILSFQSMEKKYAEMFKDERNIWSYAVSLNGIQHCMEGIYRHIASQVDKDGNTLLHLIAKNDRPGMLSNIIQYFHGSLDAKNLNTETALMIAAKSGHVRVAHMLVKAGANLNLRDRNGRTALMYAVLGDHSNVVRLLLMKSGINLFVPDVKGETAVDLAIRSDSVDIQCCFLMHSQMCS